MVLSWSTFYILRDVVHKYLGMEPSGRKFNDMELDYNHQPHNPMVNDDDSDDDGVDNDDVYIMMKCVWVSRKMSTSKLSAGVAKLDVR